MFKTTKLRMPKRDSEKVDLVTRISLAPTEFRQERKREDTSTITLSDPNCKGVFAAPNPGVALGQQPQLPNGTRALSRQDSDKKTSNFLMEILTVSARRR